MHDQNVDQDLKIVLRSLDEIIGKRYVDLAVAKSREAGSDSVRLSAKCRTCRITVSREGQIGTPGWGQRIVEGFLEKIRFHDSRHVLITPKYLN